MGRSGESDKTIFTLRTPKQGDPKETWLMLFAHIWATDNLSRSKCHVFVLHVSRSAMFTQTLTHSFLSLFLSGRIWSRSSLRCQVNNSSSSSSNNRQFQAEQWLKQWRRAISHRTRSKASYRISFPTTRWQTSCPISNLGRNCCSPDLQVSTAQDTYHDGEAAHHRFIKRLLWIRWPPGSGNAPHIPLNDPLDLQDPVFSLHVTLVQAQYRKWSSVSWDDGREGGSSLLGPQRGTDCHVSLSHVSFSSFVGDSSIRISGCRIVGLGRSLSLICKQ